KGYAAVVGEYVYSSSYDIGEGWGSTDIFPCCGLSRTLTNMNVYTGGPQNNVMFTVSAVGNALHPRNLYAMFYSDTLFKHDMSFFAYKRDTIRNISLSKLLSPVNLPVTINGDGADSTDRIVVAGFSVTYPATWNFNNEKNFYFELKDNTAGNYLVINNFNAGGVAPVLYDYNTAKRYLGDISVPGQVRFVLPASTDTLRRFNLMSQQTSNVNLVTSMTSHSFTDFSKPAQQGDYLIISNPVLYNDGSGNNYVDKYAQYRASVNGGSFNAKVFDISELTEQFGFGIRKHPSAVRDFVRYATANFAPAPKYLFIIGRGINYDEYTSYQPTYPQTDQENLVQTFGYPASDILLTSAPGTLIPLVPVGRLGAITGAEVGNYYRKMVEYEQVQRSPGHTVADKAWMKNFLFTIGPGDSLEAIDFKQKMAYYQTIVEDTLTGGHVETFTKTGVSAIEQQQSQRIDELFHEGLTYVKYFGHSSANELGINLNYPENYQNAGKYPFMQVSGCTVGNFYTFNIARVNGYNGMS
ncbi:MAG TPA: C25 family cysteine peptidase, partial [Ferruginibacter sp.]|nr:C25 family cysteine peptidase [Ferruginibacter sp.]